ncbi:MAG: DUF4922 domain-containing protein [Draconibacterium sp.]|nr:MAG: DUF4922 domain-containing protein [Draconibacterium sp.]
MAVRLNRMLQYKIISPGELKFFGPDDTLNEQALALLNQQKATWPLAAINFEALDRIQTREFDFGRFKILAQFNPERIRSSAAKTDAKTIAGRACFLCPENMPPEQKGILFQGKYFLLANPYPIFPAHLTIPSLSHTPQRIKNRLNDLLELTQDLPGFSIFYNGPSCGASAPDHFHFQAINRNMLPIETELEKGVTLSEKDGCFTIFQNKNTTVYTIENYLRRLIYTRSSSKTDLNNVFKKIYNYQGNDKTTAEPMMNMLCWFHENHWHLVIFPRKKQRPSHFYKTGESQLIVGPAAVEMAGVLVLPRKEDFEKITKTEITEIYDEVTINKEKFENLVAQFKESNTFT